MRELTDDEVDLVMANIYPENRRWCGPKPGDPASGVWCACIGCINGTLSWEDFSAWQERESQREPTPYIDGCRIEPRKLTLQERLEAYKAKKRASDIGRLP